MSYITIICVRDPDESNEFEVFGTEDNPVDIIDVDLGRADLEDADEFAEWEESVGQDVARLRERDEDAAADHLEKIIANTKENVR